MPTPLTIQMIIRNNEATVEHTLESILPLNAEILAVDIGCRDSTSQKCLACGAKVIKLPLNDDLSKVRNEATKTASNKWNFYIEPWETILNGHEAIKEVIGGPPAAYKVTIIQGDVITKQTRLWHKDMGLKFTNPVFERLPETDRELPVYIAVGPSNNSNFTLELADKWSTRCPLASEPIYYKACAYLGDKNWFTFLNLANLYLYMEKSDVMSIFMTHYYVAMVNCYIVKDYKKSVQSLMVCLAKKPTMAEFWCLLGDVYYDAKDYDKAKEFYENAIILGSRRLKDDGWPMEISKYKEYPQKMIEVCKKIKTSSKVYVTQ